MPKLYEGTIVKQFLIGHCFKPGDDVVFVPVFSSKTMNWRKKISGDDINRFKWATGTRVIDKNNFEIIYGKSNDQ